MFVKSSIDADVLLQFEELKTDFQYNLKLLNERDAELDNYDASYFSSMSTITQKEALIAELQTLVTSVQAGVCGHTMGICSA